MRGPDPRIHQKSSFRGDEVVSPESITTIVSMDSGPAPRGASSGAPIGASGNDDGYADQIPPILQTIFHSSAVTGCTDSLEYFTSAMSTKRLSALMAAIVTGVFRGLSAFKSTQTNLPVLSLGSGYASLMISAMPTISLPSLE